MLFDNPVFEGWYTDSMDVYRNVDVSSGNLDGKKRRLAYRCLCTCGRRRL